MNTDPKRLARIAGVLYLLVSLGGIVVLAYGPGRLIGTDAAATAANLRASATQARVGITVDLVSSICWLLTALALYLLLEHVDRLAALAMVGFVAIGVAVGGVRLVDEYTAVRVAAGYPGSDALTQAFAGGDEIAALFFGLWLLPLAYLVVRSGYFPRVLGVVLVIGGCSWVTVFVTHVVVPSLRHGVAAYLFVPAALAELTFVAWLLTGRVRVPGSVERRSGPGQDLSTVDSVG